ncbi:hypothetical protein [Flavobacterium proteolyticum]|uniref:Uncharacterized protein n=1 Tax=Flavobacterium proteolyticum TaxID=2911683 RepID=A0ABR9WP00_9FLAO|nr:hypothetical protein [Flavobacterium proteolyticum]MBE9575653.1 hypothetical protein [Flavobacterium proteolyticum]
MKNNKIYFAFVTLLIIAFFVINEHNKRQRKEEIENYKETTIAFTLEIKNYEDSSELKFYFYSNGKLFIGKQHSSDYFDKSILNRYYVVKHDTQNPRKNYIYLNEEIQPDSIALTKAGFKYVIYYDYDIPTNTYIKKHKWE